MRYIVEDMDGDTVEIEEGRESVNLTVNSGGDVAFVRFTPAQVKEIQFALNRARDTTEKNIQEAKR